MPEPGTAGTSSEQGDGDGVTNYSVGPAETVPQAE